MFIIKSTKSLNQNSINVPGLIIKYIFNVFLIIKQGRKLNLF